MKKLFESALGWAVTGVCVFGFYAIAHYMLKIEDGTLLLFAGCLIWSDMAHYVNKPDAKAS